MKKNILIISDDTARRDALAALLELEGYGVVCSDAGRRASVALATNPVGLMVVDCPAAFSSAGGALRTSRTVEALTDIDPFLPLLLLCGSENDLDHRTLMMADMVLTRAVEVPAVLDAIETLLAESLRERAQRKSGHIALFR